MIRPVRVSIDVSQSRASVFAFLDVMANHEQFTDHLLRDWELSGPATGVGSKARVHTRVGGMADTIDIEVTDAEAGRAIVERNVGAKGKRIGNGTYTLADLPNGGTSITFTYAWSRAPWPERLAAPLVRRFMRTSNQISLDRLASLLADMHAES